MPEAVAGRHEVVFGLRGSYLIGEGGKGGVGFVSKEYRLDVGAGAAHVLHAVFFLVAAREFVLLDHARQVIVHIGAHHETVLRAAIHRLGVEIIVFLGIFHEPAVILKFLELLGAAFVDTRVVFVRAFGEIYLGLNDVVKRHRVVACLLACFFGTKHVVGTALHLFHECFWRTHATEWFYFGHDIYLFT